jgi:hypothetical protein
MNRLALNQKHSTNIKVNDSINMDRTIAGSENTHS